MASIQDVLLFALVFCGFVAFHLGAMVIFRPLLWLEDLVHKRRGVPPWQALPGIATGLSVVLGVVYLVV